MFRTVIMKCFDGYFLCMRHSMVDIAKAPSAENYGPAISITVDADACEGNLVLGWKTAKHPRFISREVQRAHRGERACKLSPLGSESFGKRFVINHLITYKKYVHVRCDS